MAEALGLDYWLQWQVLVCALIILIPAVISLNLTIKTSKKQVHQKLKSCDLWLPCWKNLHPKWLLLYRVIAFCFMALLLCQTMVSFGPFIFFYYTQWTVALVLVYFMIGIIVSARGCWIYFKEPFGRVEDREMLVAKDYSKNAHESTTDIKDVGAINSIQQEAGALENLMQSIYHACGGAVMLTDLVFWFILQPLSGDTLTILLGLLHSVNVVFLVLDSAFNNHPFPWSNFTYFVLWSCAYVISQWTVHVFGVVTWWPYPFLELDTPWAPAWYFGLALFHIPCYGLYSLLIKAKDFILSRMSPRTYSSLPSESTEMNIAWSMDNTQ
ncbi:uncharacterized protein LOC141697540 [Apium graveolens]|uniref:uncharacterized protein LOC141697540 n=1 Tax=Apium graveolens TaxID=4045 RepID=UPI003D79AEE1